MRFHSNSRQYLQVAFGVAFAAATVVGSAALKGGVAAADEGLRGVFPNSVPKSLTDDTFEDLPESLNSWSEETQATLEALYAGKLDAAGQREKLAELDGQLAALGEAADSSDFAESRVTLLTLKGRLERRAALAKAVLGALGADPGSKKSLASLVAAIETVEADDAEAAATSVRKVLDQLDAKSPAASEKIWEAAIPYYVNYNVRVTAGEQLVREVVKESRVEERPVRDYFMGTRIVGRSTTATDIDFDLVDNPNVAEFAVRVKGNVKSRTTGYNPKATLFTSGNHYFEARKKVRFDGYRFEWDDSTISVNANNNTYGARTKFSGGLFGKLSEKIAVKEARKRRGRSEAFSRRRVRENVLPEFDAEVNEQLGENNRELAEEVRPRFEKVGLQPETIALSTSNRALVASARILGDGELAGSRPLEFTLPADAAVVQLHESAVNNGIDRIGLAGKELTETELRKTLADFATQLVGKEVTIDPPEEEDGSKFVFAKQDPIRVKFENGELVATLRTGLKREGEKDIPEQQVTVPLAYSVDGDQVKVARGTVKVSAKGGLAVAAVLRRRIQQSIPEERTREAKLELEKDDGSTITLDIESIHMIDGWFAMMIRK